MIWQGFEFSASENFWEMLINPEMKICFSQLHSLAYFLVFLLKVGILSYRIFMFTVPRLCISNAYVQCFIKSEKSSRPWSWIYECSRSNEFNDVTDIYRAFDYFFSKSPDRSSLIVCLETGDINLRRIDLKPCETETLNFLPEVNWKITTQKFGDK